MENEYYSLEDFWDDILSRLPERVKAAYGSLEIGEQQALLAHLKKMTKEKDWHPEQRKSARAALKVIAGLRE